MRVPAMAKRAGPWMCAPVWQTRIPLSRSGRTRPTVFRRGGGVPMIFWVRFTGRMLLRWAGRSVRQHLASFRFGGPGAGSGRCAPCRCRRCRATFKRLPEGARRFCVAAYSGRDSIESACLRHCCRFEPAAGPVLALEQAAPPPHAARISFRHRGCYGAGGFHMGRQVA